MQTISLGELSIVFIPAALLLAIMFCWKLKAWVGMYANLRMILQLLLVGYFLAFLFETKEPIIITVFLLSMVGISAWIVLRTFEKHKVKSYFIVLIAIGIPGLIVLMLVTQFVLVMPRWFEPSIVILIAGMIFSNSINTVSLAAERFENEFNRGECYVTCRNAALDATLIPQINSLLAVGLVAFAGMMTGQILSGIDPNIAVRYQIMVMLMIFGSGGLSAVMYLFLRIRMMSKC